MMGYAYQKGWLPLSRESLLRAIEPQGPERPAGAQQLGGQGGGSPGSAARRRPGRRPAPAGKRRFRASEGIIEMRRPRVVQPVVN